MTVASFAVPSSAALLLVSLLLPRGASTLAHRTSFAPRGGGGATTVATWPSHRPSSSSSSSPSSSSCRLCRSPFGQREGEGEGDDDEPDRVIAESESAPAGTHSTRRSVLRRTLVAATAITAAIVAPGDDGPRLLPPVRPPPADAAVGTLPEFADSNAILQSVTIDVTDAVQFEDTVKFFGKGFDMRVLRERRVEGGGSATGEGGSRDVWLGYGPEDLDVPSDFVLPVSSFSKYGGHASLHVRYDPSSSSSSSSSSRDAAPLYVRSSGEYNDAPAPGNNVAYLQLGVPTYRISQMVKHGGNVLDAYGWVNVVSPAGLPIRGVVGARSPDPMMFVAVYCDDVDASEGFYAKLGFVRRGYPYARPNDGMGQFEPPQPKGSRYLAPSANSMGILLLPRPRKRFGRMEALVPNPVLRSLNVVYAPTAGGGTAVDDDGASILIRDPSYVPISFVSQDSFEREIKATAIPADSP